MLDKVECFTRTDQINYLESEMRRISVKPSPTRAKKLAMLQDIIEELKKLDPVKKRISHGS
jgi:hypothetical protein